MQMPASGWGQFLQGQAQNAISRLVDAELPMQHEFNDPTGAPLGQAKDGSLFSEGKPSTTTIAGISLPPLIFIGAGLLAVTVAIIALRR